MAVFGGEMVELTNMTVSGVLHGRRCKYNMKIFCIGLA